MTKSKQKSNPKFQFLFGGDYYNYYMYRVGSEQALLKQQQMSNAQNTQMQPSTIPSLLPGYPPAHLWNSSPTTNPQPNQQQSSAASAQIETILIQQNTLKDQIRQSEQNLQAQHAVIIGFDLLHVHILHLFNSFFSH